MNKTHFVMHLDDGRVARNFGIHPERGRMIPGIKLERTAGLVWKGMWGRGEMVRAPVQVNPIVVLKPQKRGEWVVICDPQWAEAAKAWLSRICGVKHKKPTQRKRKHYPRERTTPPMMYIKVDGKH